MASNINLTVEQAMAAVYEQYGAPPIDREGGEFTVNDYATHLGIPYNTANEQIVRAVRAGTLVKRYVLVNGKKCNGYKIVV